MKDFLTFKRMLTPLIVYVLFWVGVLVCFGVGLYDMVTGMFFMGLGIFFLGPIAVRVACEFFILFFRMNETMTEIGNTLANQEK